MSFFDLLMLVRIFQRKTSKFNRSILDTKIYLMEGMKNV